mgnify:CR=1 FL=1
MTALLYPMVTVALWYLGSQAVITRPLWSRYPQSVDAFMSCSACSGVWLGGLVGGLGAWQRWPFLGLPGREPLTVALVAVCSLVWTPLLAALLVRALVSLERREGTNHGG